LNAAEYDDATRTLALFSTAEALTRSLTKEWWVVFKVKPLAEVLSRLLSPGGTTVPNQASDYDATSSKIHRCDDRCG